MLAWDPWTALDRYLLATDALNVKRSSAVCAILARLPGVVYTTSADEGIALRWGPP